MDHSTRSILAIARRKRETDHARVAVAGGCRLVAPACAWIEVAAASSASASRFAVGQRRRPTDLVDRQPIASLDHRHHNVPVAQCLSQSQDGGVDGVRIRGAPRQDAQQFAAGDDGAGPAGQCPQNRQRRRRHRLHRAVNRDVGTPDLDSMTRRAHRAQLVAGPRRGDGNPETGE